jgi:hypothetical protein
MRISSTSILRLSQMPVPPKLSEIRYRTRETQY